MHRRPAAGVEYWGGNGQGFNIAAGQRAGHASAAHLDPPRRRPVTPGSPAASQLTGTINCDLEAMPRIVAGDPRGDGIVQQPQCFAGAVPVTKHPIGHQLLGFPVRFQPGPFVCGQTVGAWRRRIGSGQIAAADIQRVAPRYDHGRKPIPARQD